MQSQIEIYLFRCQFHIEENQAKSLEFILSKMVNLASNKLYPGYIRDIIKTSWEGSLSPAKLNKTQKIIFVTFKRSMVEKATKNPQYKKDFEKYVYNLINHEHIHMLGESEFLAAKYGQTFDVNTSSDFFKDLCDENIIEYYDNYISFNILSDELDKITIQDKVSNKEKISTY